jgi:GxxExxY protein
MTLVSHHEPTAEELQDQSRMTDEQAHEILNAGRLVHQTLGPGFVEAVYSKAFAVELRNRGLGIEREKIIRVFYASSVVGRHYLDLVVEGRAIIELKATRSIVPIFEAQMRSYLSATEYRFGLIINFGVHDLVWKEVLR